MPAGIENRKMGRSAVTWKRGTARSALPSGSGFEIASTSPSLTAYAYKAAVIKQGEGSGKDGVNASRSSWSNAVPQH